MKTLFGSILFERRLKLMNLYLSYRLKSQFAQGITTIETIIEDRVLLGGVGWLLLLLGKH